MFYQLLPLEDNKKKACKKPITNYRKTAAQGGGCNFSMTYQFYPAVYFPTCFLQQLSSVLRNVHAVPGTETEP